MNYAGRFNSFILKGQNVFDAIKAYHEMDGITHLECKCQYKNVGFISYKHVGKTTCLYDIF